MIHCAPTGDGSATTKLDCSIAAHVEHAFGVDPAGAQRNFEGGRDRARPGRKSPAGAAALLAVRGHRKVFQFFPWLEGMADGHGRA